MNKRTLIAVLIFLNIAVISLFLILFTNSTYPIVGNDYRLFGPRLLDSLLFYKINGFGIEWYTPSFGGGLPAYPNPLQMQFSFQQLFTFFTNPWIAIMLSSVVYIAIGFGVAYLLLKDVLSLHPFAAILGAGFFVACGFFIERMIVGHTDKITYPLLVVPVYAILNRKLPAWLNGVLIGLTLAIWLNSGGVYIGVMCLFTAMVTLPLIYLIRPNLFAWKSFFATAAWGVLFTLLLCISKLYPMVLFMRNFPRVVEDRYFVSLGSSIAGAVLQLIGVMPTLPFLEIIGKNPLVLPVRLTQLTGTQYGFWEIDSSISPVLIVLLAYGLWTTIRHFPAIEKKDWWKKALAAGLLIFSIIFVFQFAEARGFLFNHFRVIPIFKSLRTNTRFISSYVLPLAMLGAMAFDHWLKGRPARQSAAAFVALNVISLAFLWTYYLLPINVQYRSFDINAVIDTYKGIEAGQTYPVTQIIPEMNDYEVFQAGASNVHRHYDPLLSGHSFTPQVHEGPVSDIQNGSYNMTDPTGYVFPAENHSELFSLIPVSEATQMEQFTQRKAPDWKLPLLQIVFDWVSGLTFVLIFPAILFYWLGRRYPALSLARLRPFPRAERP